MHEHGVTGARPTLAELERLRQVASGKSVRWREMGILLLGWLAFLLGALALVFLGASTSSILLLAVGVLSLVIAFSQILTARIDAIWKFVNSDKAA